MKSDEAIIRSALDAAIGAFERKDAIDWNCLEQASEALARLTARCIPQIPEGYLLTDLWEQENGNWRASIRSSRFSGNGRNGYGSTPRGACEAAIAALGKKQS